MDGDSSDCDCNTGLCEAYLCRAKRDRYAFLRFLRLLH